MLDVAAVDPSGKSVVRDFVIPNFRGVAEFAAAVPSIVPGGFNYAENFAGLEFVDSPLWSEAFETVPGMIAKRVEFMDAFKDGLSRPAAA